MFAASAEAGCSSQGSTSFSVNVMWRNGFDLGGFGDLRDDFLPPIAQTLDRGRISKVSVGLECKGSSISDCDGAIGAELSAGGAAHIAARVVGPGEKSEPERALSTPAACSYLPAALPPRPLWPGDGSRGRVDGGGGGALG